MPQVVVVLVLVLVLVLAVVVLALLLVVVVVVVVVVMVVVVEDFVMVVLPSAITPLSQRPLAHPRRHRLRPPPRHRPRSN